MSRATGNRHRVRRVQHQGCWAIQSDLRMDRMLAAVQQILRCLVKVVIKIHPIYRHAQAVHHHPHHPHRHLCGRNQSDNMLKPYSDVRPRPILTPLPNFSLSSYFSHGVELRLVFVTPFTNLHFHFFSPYFLLTAFEILTKFWLISFLICNRISIIIDSEFDQTHNKYKTIKIASSAIDTGLFDG